MARVALVGGAYQSRSVIASAQRCVNLYPETNPEDSQAPVPVVHFPRPGLTQKGIDPPTIGFSRALYRATNGDGYMVIGKNVYFIDSTFAYNFVGSINDGNTPVSVTDNGLVVIIVDGSAGGGWAIDMVSKAFGVITDPSFLGANKADYCDTFFVFDKPNTAIWYISLSNVTFAMLTGITGRVLGGSILAAGTLYVNATYTNVPLTGGTGSGAQGTIVVSGGGVTGVTITVAGGGYSVNDVLSASNANLGGAGSGFSYSADSVATAFDPLDIAQKSGSADTIVGLKVLDRQIWLLGTLTSEVWYDSGAADFAFAEIPGVFIEHGCAALNSIAKVDNAMLWLSQDREGHAIVVRTTQFQAQRVSTYAIETLFQNYSTISDAIGFCYQQDGHAFYILTFPTADKTWAYEIATGQWHELAYTDTNGVFHRHRASCCAFLNNMNVVGDWQNGRIYQLDPNNFTDNGEQIVCVRTFPHMIDDGNLVTYRKFIADVQVGTLPGDTTPQMSLRWSDTRGASYGNAVMQSMGNGGDYLYSPVWNRLGQARDRVFELSWSAAINTSLLGAFVETIPHSI